MNKRIPSLLWTDYYILTMAQAILHNCPSAMVRFKFKCRNGKGVPDRVLERESLKLAYLTELNQLIREYCSLRFTSQELVYLSKIRYFKPDFIEYLRLFQPNPDYVKCSIDENGELQISVEGPWLGTIWFEVPLLAICGDLYNRHMGSYDATLKMGRERLEEKVKMAESMASVRPGFSFADFGTRRAFSVEWHEEVVRYMRKWLPKNVFGGTSNVYLAMKYGLTPIGTMAHQWLQAFQQLGPRVVDSQKVALDVWAREYRGELGIALSDVVGFDAFLRDFDRYFALLFDGCRHDSGDPRDWCLKLIAHYTKLRIDPRTKVACFSDGLTFAKSFSLYDEFKDLIKMSFGIGTYLTNDMGIPAQQMVIKLVECNGRPVAKVSDSSGKGMCEDPKYLEYLKSVFQIGENRG